MRMNPVPVFLNEIKALRDLGHPIKDAVSIFTCFNRALSLRVMEEIGCWPSSETELAELQRQWRG